MIDWDGIKSAVEFVQGGGANYARNEGWIVYTTDHSIRIDIHCKESN